MGAIRNGDFVRRAGGMLTLGGRGFRFVGNNVYFNQADVAYGWGAAVEETLDKMVAAGMTVARFNAHNDNDPARDPAAIQTAPGEYVEASLAALDASIAMAKARNIRLILKLTNNWEDYGGIRRYVGWHLGRAPVQREWGFFYTEPAIRQWFRNYVGMLIDRRNTVTGITYRDEPAILAWELGNELRNPSAGKADALVAWTAEMAAYVKQIDGRHLVADGGEGFDDAPALYDGLSNRYTVSGADGCSYHRLARIPELDMLSYHLYPAGWGMDDGRDAAVYIRRHEEIAREHGKVAYLGEFGKREGDARRAGIFGAWGRVSLLEQASAGIMLWQLVDDGKVDGEGYAVYWPRDGESCAELRRMADGVAAAPVVVSAATYIPVTLAPGMLGSLFGAGLEGARLTVEDAAGRLHGATVIYSSATQVNFLVPEAAGTGAAVVRVMRGAAIVASAPVQLADVAPGVFWAVVAEGPAEGGAVISLYGTGIRGSRDVTLRAGGAEAEVLYAGPQNQYLGLDQVNARLPGTGEFDLVLTVAGVAANVVRIVVP